MRLILITFRIALFGLALMMLAYLSFKNGDNAELARRYRLEVIDAENVSSADAVESKGRVVELTADLFARLADESDLARQAANWTLVLIGLLSILDTVHYFRHRRM